MSIKLRLLENLEGGTPCKCDSCDCSGNGYVEFGGLCTACHIGMHRKHKWSTLDGKPSEKKTYFPWIDALFPKRKRSGFRKIAEPREKQCQHPDHNPPGHIVLSPGTYEYTCPGCGASQIVKVPLIRN